MAALETLEIDIAMTLKNKLSKKLVEEAEKRCVEPVVLLADIVERVLEDDLVAAVIDV